MMKKWLLATVLIVCFEPNRAEAAVAVVTTTYICDKEAPWQAIKEADQESHQAAMATAEEYVASNACRKVEQLVFQLEGDSVVLPPVEFVPADIVDTNVLKPEWKVKFYTIFPVLDEATAL